MGHKRLPLWPLVRAYPAWIKKIVRKMVHERHLLWRELVEDFRIRPRLTGNLVSALSILLLLWFSFDKDSSAIIGWALEAAGLAVAYIDLTTKSLGIDNSKNPSEQRSTFLERMRKAWSERPQHINALASSSITFSSSGATLAAQGSNPNVFVGDMSDADKYLSKKIEGVESFVKKELLEIRQEIHNLSSAAATKEQLEEKISLAVNFAKGDIPWTKTGIFWIGLGLTLSTLNEILERLYLATSAAIQYILTYSC